MGDKLMDGIKDNIKLETLLKSETPEDVLKSIQSILQDQEFMMLMAHMKLNDKKLDLHKILQPISFVYYRGIIRGASIAMHGMSDELNEMIKGTKE